MIFAAIDVWHYFRRTGPYGDAALKAKGLSIAMAENFPEWEEWPLGHILFVSTAGSVVSWVVMYVSDGPMSHTAMVYGDGILNDVTSVGVHRHPISDYFDFKSYMCVVPPPEGTDLESARRFMDRAIGARYNYLGIVLLGLHILIGNNLRFSWRSVSDILLVFGAVGLFIYFSTGQFPLITVGAGATYAAVVIFNRWRQSRRESLERRRRES